MCKTSPSNLHAQSPLRGMRVLQAYHARASALSRACLVGIMRVLRQRCAGSVITACAGGMLFPGGSVWGNAQKVLSLRYPTIPNSMIMTVTERVCQLRSWMSEQGVECMVVPTMDPHNSEYVAEHWQCRRWVSGFTGSAGTAVVTQDDARLWTDSRYWLQAEQQLADTPYTLMRDLVDIDIHQWLQQHVTGRIAYCPDMMIPALYAELFDGMQQRVVALAQDPFDQLWTDRPALPMSHAWVMPLEHAGESAQSKLDRMVQWLQSRQQSQVLVTELSEIMWLLNLRGNDIPYNPFVISHLLVRTGGAHIYYVHAQQIDAQVSAYLSDLGVTLAPYDEAPRQLEGETPIAQWRARKNAVEQEGFRQAHLRDGVAMVQLLRRLDQWSQDPDAQPLTELGVDRLLTSLRAQQPGFLGLSFETIAGYGAHGAVVHYEPTPESDIPLCRRGLLLLDSGGHYDCGSTDITRTIPLGPLTDEERTVYTLVLKGHLQLQNMRFPDGTTGLQLDTAARMAMWRQGYDYGHGTGHGVGHCLGVHEGPCQIRKNCRRDTTIGFHAGQNTTDEPGIYVPGRFGVRHENTLLCVDDGETPFGHFLRFESLTLCPYDRRPIVVQMLTPEERQWLDAYHRHVCDTLMPLLHDDADRTWLRQATLPL